MTADTIPAWPSARARVAALSRSRTEDDPEMLRARGDLQAARLAEHIARVLADAPTPSAEQLGRLAVLLTSSGDLNGAG